ncbi:hypothetical protein AALP_AA4G119100 [Arabis alpina]|uniref:Uncharacterized protein n=1 Tax=Arabis alpina TaxID=50452 RepID=A0A087H2P6_ARAAL|nr:hypothetical protein AALP_AA4G119100 [Arabis alpina]
MSRAGLRFLAFVNRMGYKLEAEIEKHKLRADAYAKGELAAKTERNKYADQLEKRDKELEKALGDNQRLRVENDRLTKKLEAAAKDASNSLGCLTSRNAQVAKLKTKVGKKREELKTAKALIVDLYEQFATAKAKFEELKGDPQDRLFAKPPLPNRDVPLERLATYAGVTDVSESHMFSESAGGLLQEMRIDSASLLKDLMISEDGRMSFAGEDEVEEKTIATEDIWAEKTKTVRIEKTTADVDGAEKTKYRALKLMDAALAY